MNTNNGNICVVHDIEQKQRSKKKDGPFLIVGKKDKS